MRSIYIALGSLGSLLAQVFASVAESPSIILIMPDDFGYECVTANGGESYQTRILTAFAATQNPANLRTRRRVK